MVRNLYAELKFSKTGQMSQSRSFDQNLWYHKKGPVIKNTHPKYENHMSYGKEVKGRVKVL